MGNSDTITIPLILPFDEAQALSQFVKRIGYEDVNRFAAPCVTYDDVNEGDVMWSAVCMLRTSLADAGFNPR